MLGLLGSSTDPRSLLFWGLCNTFYSSGGTSDFSNRLQGRATSSLNLLHLLGEYHQILAIYFKISSIGTSFASFRTSPVNKGAVGKPRDSFQATQVSSVLLIISKFSADTTDTIKTIYNLYCVSVKWGTTCLPSHWCL